MALDGSQHILRFHYFLGTPWPIWIPHWRIILHTQLSVMLQFSSFFSYPSMSRRLRNSDDDNLNGSLAAPSKPAKRRCLPMIRPSTRNQSTKEDVSRITMLQLDHTNSRVKFTSTTRTRFRNIPLAESSSLPADPLVSLSQDPLLALAVSEADTSSGVSGRPKRKHPNNLKVFHTSIVVSESCPYYLVIYLCL